MEALVRRKWTRVRFDGLLPELLWSHVAEAAHGPLLVEETDVPRDGFGDVVGIADAEIDQHLDLGPAVYRLHRPIVRRRTYTGHRPHDIIGKKRFVERLRRVHRALIRVENGSQFGVLFLQFDERVQDLEIRRRVAFFGRQAVGDDPVVPKVHVKGQLPVFPSRPERGHVADDALHRPGQFQGCQHQIGVGFPRLARRFVSVMFASAPYPGVSAAPPREFVGVDDA